MFARTERLVLRPGWQEDAAALTRAIGDEAVVRNLARAPWPYGKGDAEAYLALPRDPRLPDLLAFTRTQGAPKLVGGCAIDRRADGRLELGYWIARPYWGLGFATEAARAVMTIARATGLSGITAAHFLDNRASANVLRKVGFRPTGVIEQRHSAGRRRTVPCLLFEEGADIDMPRDLAAELYTESQPLAA